MSKTHHLLVGHAHHLFTVILSIAHIKSRHSSLEVDSALEAETVPRVDLALLGWRSDVAGNSGGSGRLRGLGLRLVLVVGCSVLSVLGASGGSALSLGNGTAALTRSVVALPTTGSAASAGRAVTRAFLNSQRENQRDIGGYGKG